MNLSIDFGHAEYASYHSNLLKLDKNKNCSKRWMTGNCHDTIYLSCSTH